MKRPGCRSRFVSPALAHAVAYACVDVTAARPNDVPPNDVGRQCTGNRQEVNVWYDPATLIPDKIEIPRVRATLLRVK